MVSSDGCWLLVCVPRCGISSVSSSRAPPGSDGCGGVAASLGRASPSLGVEAASCRAPPSLVVESPARAPPGRSFSSASSSVPAG